MGWKLRLSQLMPFLVGAAAAFLLSLPLYFLWGDEPRWRLAAIMLFLELSLLALAFSGRSFGMLVSRVGWKGSPRWWRRLAYVLADTACFAAILIWLRFPFDVLLALAALQAFCLLAGPGRTVQEVVTGTELGVHAVLP